MTCVPFSFLAPLSRASARQCAALAALTSTMLLASAARAQQPPLSVPAMRAPVLQLVQPSSGGSVPTDRPTVFFRYGPGEPTDPIDDASFQVWVDGTERTARFRVGNGEAWGTLARQPGDSSSGRGTSGVASPTLLAAGAHLVTARVCSVRGICSATHDVLLALPTAAERREELDARLASANARAASDSTRGARRKRHSHLKQPLTLVGDLVGVIGKLFR